MKGIPKRIFLQIGEDISPKDNIDFKELGEVTWCLDKINKTDIEYILKTKKKKNMKKLAVILLLPLFLISCSTKKLAIKNNHSFKKDYTIGYSNPFPHF